MRSECQLLLCLTRSLRPQCGDRDRVDVDSAFASSTLGWSEDQLTTGLNDPALQGYESADVA